MKVLLFSLCLLAPCSLAGAIITFTEVRVLGGQATLGSNPTSLSGSGTFAIGFGFPPPQAVNASWSGSSTVSASGALRARISLSAGSPFANSTPLSQQWGGISGAAIAEWADTWSYFTTDPLIGGLANFEFTITGNGQASMNLYGTYQNGTSFSVVQAIGPGTTTISVPISANGTPSQLKARLIVGGGGFGNPPGSYSSDYSNTVTLTALSLTNASGSAVPFGLSTTSGNVDFESLAPLSSNVPEPSAWLLSGAGIAALMFARKRL